MFGRMPGRAWIMAVLAILTTLPIKIWGQVNNVTPPNRELGLVLALRQPRYCLKNFDADNGPKNDQMGLNRFAPRVKGSSGFQPFRYPTPGNGR